jgi:two-component system phosphate regulon sensor histidine kinase PhoR
MLAVHETTLTIIVLAAAFALAAALAIVFVTNRSLRKIRRGAERFARGDLSRPVSVTGPPQVAGLAAALNQMADQLRERLAAVERQRNESGAVLASLNEGVVAIDDREQIFSINPAAARMLKTEPAHALGRSIHEAVRNPELHRLIDRALAGESGVQAQVTFRGSQNGRHNDRVIQVHGAALRDGRGKRIGVLVVLNDVTQLLRLESVRQDFVSNVSHEIKTPVSAIKAAAETLIGDNGDQAYEDTQRFLQIVVRQSDRLHAIVEDLLALARIEQESRDRGVELEPGPVAAVIRSAIETCQARADEKRIAVRISMGDGVCELPMNAPLLEQALVNLLDNAIKYSPAGAAIDIRASCAEGECVIEVIDNGPGIEAVHLPRLFERFYRTDKARSRALGGTGLGLAIVKHIVLAHRGRVSVESNPGAGADEGHGSTFRIHLPMKLTDAGPKTRKRAHV